MSAGQDPNPKLRPGFFSRLFNRKHVADAETKAQASIEEVPVDAVVEPVPPSAAEPPAQAVASAPVAEKKGFFSGWFGRSDKKTEAPSTAPAAAPAPAAASAPSAPADSHKSWFDRLKDRLRKGSGDFISAVRSAFGASGKLDADTVERLEEILVAADVSVETTLKIVKKLEARVALEKAEGAERLMELFREVLTDVFAGSAKPFAPQAAEDGPHVVMVVGVNGVGKTTTIGKMAKRCRDAGLSVMLVAGDTFRAAAVEQLEVWSQRTGCEFEKTKHGGDPSGLVFDALQRAKARGIDVVFIDTAGRLQTKSTLMEELGKIHRVAGRVLPGTPHETLLVIDATTGQNAVNQVRAFSEAVGLTGLVMTKLDGTAKGGILITIRDQFEVPVTLIGVGEGVDDLRDFDPAQFAQALFGGAK